MYAHVRVRGYNFTTQKWAVPARVIHDLIGYSTLLLVLFQAAIGMVKIASRLQCQLFGSTSTVSLPC